MSSNNLLPQLRWSGRTHVGRVRKNNEDAFLALTFNEEMSQFLGKDGEASLDIGDFVFAVSDGMGGANAGEFASKIAVDKIGQLLPKTFRARASGLRRGGHDLLEEIFIDTHREMQSISFHYEECKGMGATLSLCWFTPEKAYFAHIGDSRIYYLPKDGGFRQITEDHSHVGWLQRTGQITETQARFHPKKNIITKALGSLFNESEPQLGTVEYEPGDKFLICSDGLTDSCGNATLEDALLNIANDETPAAKRLLKEALTTQARDNITVLIVEVM